MQKECMINSPVFFKSPSKNLIPPIVCKNKIYIISDKKLYELLLAIDKFNLYVRTIRIKGYKYTAKWLKEHKLFNEYILEEISYYSLANNFKNLKTYLAFDKQNNLTANINSEYFHNYFEKILIYNYIKQYKKEFNLHLKDRLEIIENELKELKNTPYFRNRKNYYQKKIFNEILNSFLNKMFFDPTKEFYLTNNLFIKTQSNILSSALGVYKISGLKQYRNHSLTKTNIRYKECLKPQNCFKIKFIYSCKNNNKTDLLLEKSQNFIKDKFKFEKEYISGLINKNSKNIIVENKPLCSKAINSIEESYFNNLYEKIENSNIAIKSLDNILKSILLINTDIYNIKKLNSILEKPKHIYSEIVELAQESTSNDLESFGYALIN